MKDQNLIWNRNHYEEAKYAPEKKHIFYIEIVNLNNINGRGESELRPSIVLRVAEGNLRIPLQANARILQGQL